MAIVLSGTTGIDAGSLPVSNCGNTEVEGNLNLSGVGTRITGDFSNVTASNRVAFQTSVANGNTGIYAIPNAISGIAAFRVTNSNDLVNHNSLEISASQSVTSIISNSVGTASSLPITFVTGGSERVRIDTAGNVGIGTSSPVYKLNVVESSGGTTARFENTPGNPYTYTGITLNCNNSSSSVYKGIFYDFRNENNIALGGVHCDVNTDGSSEIFFDTTPAGVRTTDRRVVAGKFTKSGDFLLISGTGGLGYGTGAGGTVTQLTSKTTAVTLNKPSGQITVNGSALAGGTWTAFVLNNNLVASQDTLVAFPSNGNYLVQMIAQNQTVYVGVLNKTGVSLSESFTIQFSIIKGANA